jgi:hypothetical protein
LVVDTALPYPPLSAVPFPPTYSSKIQKQIATDLYENEATRPSVENLYQYLVG